MRWASRDTLSRIGVKQFAQSCTRIAEFERYQDWTTTRKQWLLDEAQGVGIDLACRDVVIPNSKKWDRCLTMRILIVEDAIHVAKLLAESVRLQGHEPIVASSGKEGLSLLKQRTPDAVFLDIVMPEVSGIDVLRQIRENHPALPVIVITGSASSEEIDEAWRLGVTDVIEKPFVLKQLDQALGNLQAERP